MKRFLCLIVLVVVAAVTAETARAAESSDRFVEIYFLIQAGDTARAANDSTTAVAKYKEALGLLRQIKSDKPDWHPQIVEYRLKYCTQQLQALGAPAPVSPVAPTAKPKPPVAVRPTSPVLPPAPAPDVERLQELNHELRQAQDQIKTLESARTELEDQLNRYRQQAVSVENEAKLQQQIAELRTLNDGLTAKLEEARADAGRAALMATELQRAQDQIRVLEASKADLNVQLQGALTKAADAQVEELLKKNAELTAELATAQNKITDLTGRADSAAAADAGRIQLRAELERLQTENQSLRKSRDESVAQLAESERQLRGARAAAGKNDELIAQLRRENTLMRELIQGQPSKSRQRGSFSEDTTSSNELRNWRPRRRPPAATTQMSESATEKLVATLSAPVATAPPERSRDVAVSPSPVTDAAKAVTPVPVEPVASAGTATMLEEARELLTKKDPESAAQMYEKVLEREPDNMPALASLALIRYQQGKLDEAETILRKTIASQPNDSRARSMMGVISFRRGKIEEAYNELTRAVALDPRNAEAHNYLGIVMNEKGWPAAAEQEVRRAIELNPRYADAHFNLAVMYARQKTPRYELSRYHYQQAMDLGAARDEKLEALLKDAGATPK